MLESVAPVSFEKLVTKALAAAGDYAANDVLSESAAAGTVWTFDVARVKGGSGIIHTIEAIGETQALATGNIRIALDFYNAAPTCNLNDNVANTSLVHADIASFVGRVILTGFTNQNGDAVSMNTINNCNELPLQFKCASNDTKLYAVAVILDAFASEVAGDDLTIVIKGELY